MNKTKEDNKQIIRRVSKNVGGSLTVVIPPRLAKEIGVDGGDYVRMETCYGSGEQKGKIITLKKLNVST